MTDFSQALIPVKVVIYSYLEAANVSQKVPLELLLSSGRACFWSSLPLANNLNYICIRILGTAVGSVNFMAERGKPFESMSMTFSNIVGWWCQRQAYKDNYLQYGYM